LKKEDVTLPGLLQAAGYRTIHVGKGHFGARAFEGAARPEQDVESDPSE
jgi:arylsulfatase A-like enzyme